MRIIRYYAILLASLAILAILPANGSPSLLIGSTASYQLNGTSTGFQSCTSTNITVAAIACGSTVPFQTSPYVFVNDDTRCFFFNDTFCNFNSNNVTISVSGTVTWERGNGNLTHSITSDTGLFNLYLPSGFNFSAFNPSFTFQSAGTFSYHCIFHPWMKGEVVVIQPVPRPPTVQSFTFNGPIGWTVTGLDDNAQLELSHKISAYNSTATPPSKLYNESGIAQDSVELSTRKDSSFNPFAFLYGLPYPSPGFSFPSGSGYYYPYSPEGYTVWWVNGPLKAGSTIEVLTIHAAVRGSESVNLGPTLGTNDGWLISYLNSESYNQTQPSSQSSSYYCYTYPPYPYPYPGPGPIWIGQDQNPVCYTSGSSNVGSLNLDYGQKSDLLFNLDTTTDTYLQTTTVYPAGSFVYGTNYNYYYGNGIRVSSPVKVVRTSRSTASTSLKLTATSLDLSSRTIPPATSSGGTTSGPISSMASAWMYGTVSVVAAALVGVGVWAATRARRRGELTPELQLAQSTI